MHLRLSLTAYAETVAEKEGSQDSSGLFPPRPDLDGLLRVSLTSRSGLRADQGKKSCYGARSEPIIELAGYDGDGASVSGHVSTPT